MSPFDHIKPSFEIVSSSRARNSALFLDNNNPKQLNRILPLLPNYINLIKPFNRLSYSNIFLFQKVSKSNIGIYD